MKHVKQIKKLNWHYKKNPIPDSLLDLPYEKNIVIRSRKISHKPY